MMRKLTSVLFREISGQGIHVESYCRNLSIARSSVFPFPQNWRDPGVDLKAVENQWKGRLLWRFPNIVFPATLSIIVVWDAVAAT